MRNTSSRGWYVAERLFFQTGRVFCEVDTEPIVLIGPRKGSPCSAYDQDQEGFGHPEYASFETP